MIKDKTFKITYYSNKDGKHITRTGTHDDKSRYGVAKNGTPYYVYYDLDAHSSMALSIYSPSNLADLLTDEVEQTRDEKIAIAKKLLLEQQNSLN